MNRLETAVTRFVVVAILSVFCGIYIAITPWWVAALVCVAAIFVGLACWENLA